MGCFARQFLALALISVSQLLAQEPVSLQDVTDVMHHVFEEHVQYKQMTPELMQRAAVLYIEQFDPLRIYLLQSEVQPYMKLSKYEQEKLVSQFEDGTFPFFAKLDLLFGKAVSRARQERKALSESNIIVPWQQEGAFAKTEQELQKRMQGYMYSLMEQENGTFSDRKQKVDKLLEQKENEYLDKKAFAQHLLKALASSLDAHTQLFNSHTAEALKIGLEKRFLGFGLLLQKDDHAFIIEKILPGSSAQKSQQIQVGDLLISLNHISLKDKSIDQVQEMLHLSSTIVFELMRDGKTFEVTLQAKEIPLQIGRVSYSYEQVPNGIIGTLVIPSFYQGDGISTEQDVKQAIIDLRKQGNLQGIVLDLRSNPGGYLMQAIKVAGLFMRCGVVVITKGQEGKLTYFRTMHETAFFSGPIVVLVSKTTASAAEIVAQCLQAYGLAIVVGDEHTYGKGSIQMQNVTQGDGLPPFEVTIGEYFGVSGISTQLRGVVSDIVVPGVYDKAKIGEEDLEYQLAPEKISSAYVDPLTDISPNLRDWYLHNYMPYLQKKESRYKEMLPRLKRKSGDRLKNNATYQDFLQGIPVPKEEIDQIQKQEAQNILKDIL
jgi:carboxyl-terminal processing protease